MDLYFSPLACSMATKIALYEAGATRRLSRGRSQDQTGAGRQFRLLRDQPARAGAGAAHRRRRDPDGKRRDPAICRRPFSEADVAPAGGASAAGCSSGSASSAPNCTRACSCRCSTSKAGDDVKSYTLAKQLSRLAYLERYLEGRDYLLDRFSVADAYLATVLNWSMATPMIDFNAYPAVKAYLARMRARPSIARALAEELELYKAEVARHKAA